MERLLKGGVRDGVYFLHGDAARLREEAARRLVEAALDPSTRDFNLDVYSGEDVEPRSLAAALAMPPMMAARRVVRLSDAQALAPTGREVVQRAAEEPPERLVFVITARIPDRSRAAFYKVLKERCTSLEWTAPRGEEIPGWLVERARDRHGVRLEGRAARAMVSAVGEDLSLLEAELEKLAASVGEGEPISPERVVSTPSPCSSDSAAASVAGSGWTGLRRAATRMPYGISKAPWRATRRSGYSWPWSTSTCSSEWRSKKERPAFGGLCRRRARDGFPGRPASTPSRPGAGPAPRCAARWA